MSIDSSLMLPPRVLIVDDEVPVHASVRLCLSKDAEVVSRYSPTDALKLIGEQRFDLCVVDIRMPEMDGLHFIESARDVDPGLGYVILSGFDSHENLIRAVPLQVYDFIPKPLLPGSSLERLASDWVRLTRERRQEIAYAKSVETIDKELELVKMERDVESAVSASAREALLQAASHLTTLRALLLSGEFGLDSLEKGTPALSRFQRTLQEARRHADFAADVVENYFASAYADRETSPARVDPGVSQALAISARLAHADDRNVAVDLVPLGQELSLSGLAGIEFLLLLVPLLSQSLLLAENGTTLHMGCHLVERLDGILERRRAEKFVWVNRRQALLSHPCVAIEIRSAAPALAPEDVLAWVREEPASKLHTPCRGLIHGLGKAKGVLGIAVTPSSRRFQAVLGLPVAIP